MEQRPCEIGSFIYRLDVGISVDPTSVEQERRPADCRSQVGVPPDPKSVEKKSRHPECMP